MPTTRHATFRYHFTSGYVDLCPDCSAVLQREGEVAGDPREEAVTLAGLIRCVPAPLGADCDTCASLKAYEDALNDARAAGYSPATGRDISPDGVEPFAACPDTTFGTPEEHARWHEIHDTPTLAELEGEDACGGDGERWCNQNAETYCDRHAEELRRYVEETPF